MISKEKRSDWRRKFPLAKNLLVCLDYIDELETKLATQEDLTYNKALGDALQILQKECDEWGHGGSIVETIYQLRNKICALIR